MNRKKYIPLKFTKKKHLENILILFNILRQIIKKKSNERFFEKKLFFMLNVKA